MRYLGVQRGDGRDRLVVFDAFCYAQALGVVDAGSLLVELSGRVRVRSGRPSCRASQGQNHGIRRGYRVSGKSGNWPEDQRVHK